MDPSLGVLRAAKTPLPQDDNGEREDIGRVRAPALRGLEKVPPFRKGREKDGAQAGPQRLKPVSLVCLNRSAEALRHPNSAAPTHQSKTGIDGDPGCSATQVHSAAATPFRKEARKGCTRRLSRLRLRGNAWILRWESFARRRTPLPQDDNGERKGIGQVRAPAPTWLGKSSHCFAKSRFLTAKADSE